jgi:hypothetical protein
MKIIIIVNFAVLLISCSPLGSNQNPQNLLIFSNKTVEIVITDSLDKTHQSKAYQISQSLESLRGTYSLTTLKYAQLYYYSFIGDYELYGNKSILDLSFYENTGNYLVSPIQIFNFNANGHLYTIFLKEKSIFDDYDESYRSSVKVFREEDNKITQIRSSEEFCPTNAKDPCSKEWSYINNLYRGIIDTSLRPNAATFYVNEILLSNARINFDHPYFKTLRLLGRYFQFEFIPISFGGDTYIGFQPWNLGLSYKKDLSTLTFSRRRERYCYPSLSDCQEILNRNSDSISFDFVNKKITFYSNYRWKSTSNPVIYQLSNNLLNMDYDKITNNLIKQFNISLFQEYLFEIIQTHQLNQSDIFQLLLYYIY